MSYKSGYASYDNSATYCRLPLMGYCMWKNIAHDTGKPVSSMCLKKKKNVSKANKNYGNVYIG